MQLIVATPTVAQPTRLRPGATAVVFGAKSRETLRAPVGNQTVVVAPTLDLIPKDKMLELSRIPRVGQRDRTGLWPLVPAYVQVLREGLKKLREERFADCWVLLPSVKGIYDDCKKATGLPGYNFPPKGMTQQILEGLAVEDALTQIPRGLFAVRAQSIGLKAAEMPRFLLPPVQLDVSLQEKAMDERLTPVSKMAIKLLRGNFAQPGEAKTHAELLHAVFHDKPPGIPGGPRKDSLADYVFGHALDSLMYCGILAKTESGGKNAYRLNPDHTLYAQIQAALTTKSP